MEEPRTLPRFSTDLRISVNGCSTGAQLVSFARESSHGVEERALSLRGPSLGLRQPCRLFQEGESCSLAGGRAGNALSGLGRGWKMESGQSVRAVKDSSGASTPRNLTIEPVPCRHTYTTELSWQCVLERREYLK